MSMPSATIAPNARTLRLLEAPVLATLLRLALPNVLVMLAQSATGLVETAFVGRLGTDALAGMSLVFPGVMLMQMIGAGAMGGGIASAIARALGAGRRDDADGLVLHALAINGALGLAFTVAGLLLGPAFYRALGGDAGALAAANQYSSVVFGGAILMWVMNALASCIRGTGNMLVPALVIGGGAVLLVPVSPMLIFGYGPVPRLGVVGGGVAMLLYYAGASVIFAAYLRSRRAAVRLRLARLQGRALWDILRIGLVAALVSLQTQIIVSVATSLVGRFGTPAIAGYGVGARLEYLLIPLVFGFGAPLVAMVGTNIGAGQQQRALRVAWMGAWLAFGMTEFIGIVASLYPDLWLRIFAQDPAVLAAGRLYLRLVGPAYGFFGLGTAIYFASQGAGRMRWPLIAALLRTVFAAAGGYAALTWTGRLAPVFMALAAGLLVLGVVNAAALVRGAWFGPALSNR
ncbi:MAG: MATE family efflux transporter [Acetobacteraceae bacterium]|nr:MATE family efflux transporter [Acetobacteraceae bacterium]